MSSSRPAAGTAIGAVLHSFRDGLKRSARDVAEEQGCTTPRASSMLHLLHKRGLLVRERTRYGALLYWEPRA